MTSEMGVGQAVAILNQLLKNSQTKLTHAQWVVFQHCWMGQSYREIADSLCYDYDYIKQVGSQLWRLLSQALDEPISKNNIRSVLWRQWQTKLGGAFIPGADQAADQLRPQPRCHWGEAIDIAVFFERQRELATLTSWIQQEQCRLITLLGMGGIGKTALSVKLSEQLVGVKRWAGSVQPEADQPETQLETQPEIGQPETQLETQPILQPAFQILFWRSLRDAPPLAELLSELIQFLAQSEMPQMPESVAGQLTLLLNLLQQNRALIVLDNFDAVLAAGEQGSYRSGYADYGELLRRLGEIPHQSCVVLTSREKPQEVTALAGDAFAVRVLPLQGLSETGGRQLLQAKGLSSTATTTRALLERYAGNPLALKIAATSIQDLFGGDLNQFLQQKNIAFSGINQLLQQQVKRLSSLELQIMNWLAINRESVTVAELQSDMTPTVSTATLLEALESLSWRSLIEQSAEGFTQQPVVMEYITNCLVKAAVQEITSGAGAVRSPSGKASGKMSSKAELPQTPTPDSTQPLLPLLQQYALVKATAKDYIRESQTRMLVEPIVSQAETQLGNSTALQNWLYQIFEQLRLQEKSVSGYLVGNVINLLRYLKTDFTGFDFSGCAIWQAYLADVNLHHVNFSNSELAKCSFAETFGGILSLAFSPCGEQLAIGDSNGEIRVWDWANSRSLLSFKAHEIWVWSLAISPNGKLLASSSDDNTAKIWSLETGQCLRTITAHTGSVLSVAFSPDGRWLATCSDDRTIRLWDLATGADQGSDRVWQETHQQRVWGLCFSPDGKMLASSSEDHSVKLWRVESGECLQTLLGHTDWIRAINFHPTQPLLASGSHDQTIYLWDFAGNCLQTFRGHTAPVTSVAFSRDGQILASTSHDQTVRLWQVETGHCLQVLRGHTNRLWSVMFSPDGRWLASGGDDNAAKLWDWQRGCCVKTFQGHTNAVLPMSLSPAADFLASGHEDETVKIWDIKKGELLRTLRGHHDRIWMVAFAPRHVGKNLLASGSGDQTVKLWNWRTGTCLKTLTGHESWVWSVKFHPNKPILASGSYDTTVKLWDTNTGTCLRTLEGHQASVVGTLFSPDGKWIASCGFDQTIRFWDVQTGECLRIFTGHSNTVWQLALSPDQRQLASCSYDQTIKIWDLLTGECLQTLAGHVAPIVTLSYAPDGRLFSAGFDQTIRVWDVGSATCLQTLTGHESIVSHLLVSDRLISSSFDETIKFWDLHSGTCLDSWRTPRPYEGLNIANIKGLTEAQLATLTALGAVETESSVISLFGRQRPATAKIGFGRLKDG